MFKKLYIIFFCTFFLSKASCNENIGYLDMDFIFNNSNYGKKIINEIKNENQKIIDELKIKEEKLIALENDLKKKKKILSKEEFEKQFKDLASQVNSFRNNKKKKLDDFELDKNKKISIFFDSINPILKEYLKVNSINIILDKKNIIIANNELDITNDLNQLINEKLK